MVLLMTLQLAAAVFLLAFVTGYFSHRIGQWIWYMWTGEVE